MVPDIVGQLRQQWAQPRETIHRGERCPFLLVCAFASGAARDLDQFPLPIPDDVRQFWLTTRKATLFKDEQCGQWGIEVLSPSEALAETSRQLANRPKDILRSDLVLARFFGDADLVLVTCDPHRPDFGSVKIPLPLDPRIDWPIAADSFAGFLERLAKAQGDKFWEVRD